MLKTTGIALAALLAFAGVVSAQDGRATGRIDQDGDRRVSLAEMQARAAQRFVRLDTDRNGQLTQEERRAGRAALRAKRAERREGRVAQRGERRAERLARLDVNRDGQIGQAEAPPRLAQRFAQLDTDRNGALSRAELQARAGMRGQAVQAVSRDPARVRPDANRDGVVTLAETQARVAARFAAIDADRDGFLSRQERRSHRQNRRG
jgi:Ca2+-binding EF-hand superfamily protein